MDWAQKMELCIKFQNGQPGIHTTEHWMEYHTDQIQQMVLLHLYLLEKMVLEENMK